MGRSKETFGKKEVRNKQIKKRKEKELRKREKKGQGKSSFDDMIAWVDENGQILSEPPLAENKQEVIADQIEVSIPKGGVRAKEIISKGKIRNFDIEKGFGFISSMQQKNSVFFHINDCEQEVRAGDKVEFETENGPKGLKAFNVKKVV